MSERAPLVAIAAVDPLLATAFEVALNQAGFRTVTMLAAGGSGHGASLRAFLEEHDPDVALSAVAPPYLESWRQIDDVAAALPDCPFVVLAPLSREHLGADQGQSRTELVDVVEYENSALLGSVRRALAKRALHRGRAGVAGWN